MEIILSSRNQSKIHQIQGIFEGSRVKILSLDDAKIEGEAFEDGTTLEMNALKKAMYAYEQSGGNYCTMADDTGIFIEAFQGEPGVNTAFWGSDEGKTTTEKVLAKMEGQTNRNATFETVVAVVTRIKEVFVFRGEVKGVLRDKIEVTPQPQMPYSPLFQPLGQDKVWAEMTREEENAISHRGIAFRKVREFLETGILT